VYKEERRVNEQTFLIMKTLLWLDDLRNPYLNKQRRCPDGYIVYWVTNYSEFIEWIEKFGLPDAISFDHDLGEVATGMDCAKWLVNYCLDNNRELPEFYVHSANPVGAENIKTLLENYKKHTARHLDLAKIFLEEEMDGVNPLIGLMGKATRLINVLALYEKWRQTER